GGHQRLRQLCRVRGARPRPRHHGDPARRARPPTHGRRHDGGSRHRRGRGRTRARRPRRRRVRPLRRPRVPRLGSGRNLGVRAAAGGAHGGGAPRGRVPRPHRGRRDHRHPRRAHGAARGPVRARSCRGCEAPNERRPTVSILIDNIGLLVTNEPDQPERTDAALVIDDGVVSWVGAAADAPAADELIDAEGRCVIPGFVDSHSHIVFAGDRADEFEFRMRGEKYAAGGIRRTVRLTRAASDEELLANAARLVAEMRAQGTTTVEIKSGYGLTTHDEERALRIAGTLTDETTFLGAHVVPEEFADDPAGYVALVTGEMLDACAPHAKWVDVFCDQGAFDEDQARAILTAGQARGLQARMHGGQLGPSGAVRLAVELGAASVDHCTFLTGEDVDALANSDTVATLLPGVEFSTRQPYPDA